MRAPSAEPQATPSAVQVNVRTASEPLDSPVNNIIPDTDVDRLRGYVVQWLLDNCAGNKPDEEANFNHHQLSGFRDYDVIQTGVGTWTFTSGSETWNITESPILQVDNPHGNSWCLK